MNRLWIGIIILLAFLVVGLGLMWGSVAFFGSISREMEACAEAALAENWPLATEKAEKCRIKWEAYSHFWAAFTDHEPIEQMHDLFSQLHIYGQQRFAGEFAAYCYSIANESEAIRESHGLAWWSIL